VASRDSRCTRRAALIGLGAAAMACRSGSAGTSQAGVNASAATERDSWGGLAITQVTNQREDERGGIVLVLLHGYGASGDDLASLARTLLRPGLRCILPAAPLSAGDGRAWWQIEARDRPRYVVDQPAPAQPSTLPNPELEAARSGVSGVLRTARARYAPSALFLGGFSQGAMLSLDLLLAGSDELDRVAVLSGALLVDSAAHFDAKRAEHPPVFVSHGLRDQRLPFAGGERIKTELEAHGFPVTFRSFDGGHAIPREIVSELGRFLFGS
jgi:phospholipase/carboxylesterase